MLFANKRMRRQDRIVSDEQFWCDAVVRTSDPTGTFDLRRKFASAVGQRFRKARLVIQKAVVEQDVLGLKANTTSPLAMAGSTGNRELGFQTWVDNLLKRVVVEDGMWMRPYMQASYGRAIVRAMRLTNSPAHSDDATETVAALTVLCYTELQGIAEAVSQRIMRAALQAWLHNETPGEAFKEMDAGLLKVGGTRSDAMAELMVVKAFTTGTLDQFEAAGRTHVGLVAETRPRARDARTIGDAPFRGTGPGSRIGRTAAPSKSTINRIKAAARRVELLGQVNVETAGDEDVCPECEDIEADNPYTINEARGLIPAHPRCRCAFVPLDEDDLDEDGMTVRDYNENHGEGGRFASAEEMGGGSEKDKDLASSDTHKFMSTDHVKDMIKGVAGKAMEHSHELLAGATQFALFHVVGADYGPDVEAVINHEITHLADNAKVTAAIAHEKLQQVFTKLKALRAKAMHRDGLVDAKDEIAVAIDNILKALAAWKGTIKDGWDEGDHERDEHGRFTETSGGTPTDEGRDTKNPLFSSGIKEETDELAKKVSRKDFEPGRGGRVVEVDLRQLESGQKDFDRSKVDRLKAIGWDEVAAGEILVAEKDNGKFVIFEGNHRAVAAIELGHKTIKAHSIKLEELREKYK